MNGKTNFLLDTNIVVGFLNGDRIINPFFENHLNETKLKISQITHLELLGYPKITHDEETVIKKFLKLVEILPLNDIVAEKTILLRRTTRLKLPDAIIAATAIVNRLTLVTCDTHFSTTPELQNLNPHA